MKFRVIAIDTEIVEEVRAAGRSPRYGHPTHVELAAGYGPCRHCLRTFRIGKEKRILFTYDSFSGIAAIPLPGPVFIHEAPCHRYGETSGYPPDMQHLPVVLTAYARQQKLVTRQVLGAGDQKSAAVASLLNHSEVEYIEVRDRTAGCFDFRIKRAAERDSKC